MTYKLIKGEFHIFYPDIPRLGPEPDGDTIKFKPDTPALVEGLRRSGSPPDFNGRHIVSLRFEGIDALETHFEDMHQNMDRALAARDELLSRVGFGAITYFQDLPFKVQSVEHHPRRGYILANTLDDHGRIVAFAYADDIAQVDGAQVFLDTAKMDESLNAQLLAGGLVYPLFYTTLPIDRTDHLKAVSIQAREAQRGLWAGPRLDINQPLDIPNLAVLQNAVMWPKLFRRLALYFAAGNQGLAGFDAWLRADPAHRDDGLILPNRELGNLHDLISVSGDRLQLQYRPEEVIILPSAIAGTHPGSGTRPPPAVKAVRIIAALVNPAGAERGNEVVTLFNTSPEAVDLTGWSLADRTNKRHQLQGLLAAGTVQQIRLSSRVSLGNDGDTITLFNGANEQVDQVSYTAAQASREGWTIMF